MKHYGDITKLSGYDLPIVDVITGGSPCQDLSVAGKRAGLAGERSGLFVEQIRLVKEMRTRDGRDNGRSGFLVRPRYMVWENVPGAFSSNNGDDFKAVLEKIVGIVETDVPDLRTVVRGGWTKSGCLYSQLGNWSIAWTVHNAAEWGVPQRRVRISVVADFGGLSAPEILFERKGLSRDPESCRETRKETAGATEASIDVTVYNGENITSRLNKSVPKPGDPCHTLGTDSRNYLVEPILLESNQNHATVQTDGISTALPASMGMGGGYVPMVTNWDGSQISSTLTSRNAGGNQRMPDKGNFTGICVSIGNGQTGTIDKLSNELARTLDTMHDAQAIMIGNSTSIVRRLTPLECERLQGFPDGWTDIGDWTDSKGKKHKGDADSPRYKALGNSIALPFWQYLARRICAQYERPVTLGSLFDGIGGFPLVFSRCGAIPVWASEIEEFPIAITKYHFPEKE